MKITLTHDIYPDLSNEKGWDVKVGEEFSMGYLKRKDIIDVIVIIIIVIIIIIY